MPLNAFSPRFLVVLLALLSVSPISATPLHYESREELVPADSQLALRSASHAKGKSTSAHKNSSKGAHGSKGKHTGSAGGTNHTTKSSGTGGKHSKTASKKTGSKTSKSKSTSGTGGAATGGKGGGALLSMLFPVKSTQKWTTAGGPGSLPLSDATLQITKKGQPAWSYVTFAGKKALKAHYPKGSYRPNAKDAPKGGISFYAAGPKSVDLTTAKEATFGYSVYFPKGFAWVKGGKLPGFYGGDDATVAVGCSGGRRDVRCFSSRLMWRPAGAGELYTYLPPYNIKGFEANGHFCKDKNTECNPTYGASIARGAFHFKEGDWTTVTERVKLNTPGKADGEIELSANGKRVAFVNGIIIRDSAKGKIRGIQMQSFFGGSTRDWATPKDQDVYFADLSVAITQKE